MQGSIAGSLLSSSSQALQQLPSVCLEFPQHCMVPDPRLLGVSSVPVKDSDLGSIMYNVLDIFNGVAENEI